MSLNEVLDNLVGKNNWIAYCINLEFCEDRRKTFDAWANDIGRSSQNSRLIQ